MSTLKSEVVHGLAEALAVIGVASLAVTLAEPYIGAENVAAAYRAALGAYLAVRAGCVVIAARKALREGS